MIERFILFMAISFGYIKSMTFSDSEGAKSIMNNVERRLKGLNDNDIKFYKDINTIFLNVIFKQLGPIYAIKLEQTESKTITYTYYKEDDCYTDVAGAASTSKVRNFAYDEIKAKFDDKEVGGKEFKEIDGFFEAEKDNFLKEKVCYIIVVHVDNKILLAIQSSPSRFLLNEASTDKNKLLTRVMNSYIETEIRVDYAEEVFDSTKIYLESVANDFIIRLEQIITDITSFKTVIKDSLKVFFEESNQDSISAAPSINKSGDEIPTQLNVDIFKELLTKKKALSIKLEENEGSIVLNLYSSDHYISDINMNMEFGENNDLNIIYTTDYGSVTDTINFPTKNVVLKTIETRLREIIDKLLKPIYIFEQKSHQPHDSDSKIIKDLKSYLPGSEASDIFSYYCGEIEKEPKLFEISINFASSNAQDNNSGNIIIQTDDIKNIIEVKIKENDKELEIRKYPLNISFPLDIYIWALINKQCYYRRMLKPIANINNEYRDSFPLFVSDKRKKHEYYAYDFFTESEDTDKNIIDKKNMIDDDKYIAVIANITKRGDEILENSSYYDKTIIYKRKEVTETKEDLNKENIQNQQKSQNNSSTSVESQQQESLNLKDQEKQLVDEQRQEEQSVIIQGQGEPENKVQLLDENEDKLRGQRIKKRNLIDYANDADIKNQRNIEKIKRELSLGKTSNPYILEIKKDRVLMINPVKRIFDNDIKNSNRKLIRILL